ncbi:glucose dehydrogenase, partial [Aphis craccivora]
SFSIEYGFTMRSAGFPPLFEYGLSYLAETFKLKSHEPINRTMPMNISWLGFDGNQCKFQRDMGGSSILNYMIYTRGNRKDYDDWADMGNTGSVLKYFIKSENANLSQAESGYHGKNGLLSVTEVPYYRTLAIAMAFVEAGSQIGLPVIDVNGEKQIGINYLQVSKEINVATMKNGRRWSTNTAFLFLAKRRPNLHMTKLSTVTQILIESFRHDQIGLGRIVVVVNANKHM